jgi:hypothetical protein
LPGSLREPATLFYVHECSHQDIAVFLGLPVATVNNRLHRARFLLKERMPKMTESTLRPHDLPDDFILMPPFSPQCPGSLDLAYSISGALKQEGYSEGTASAVQTLFLRDQAPARPQSQPIQGRTRHQALGRPRRPRRQPHHHQPFLDKIGVDKASDPLSPSPANPSNPVSDAYRPDCFCRSPPPVPVKNLRTPILRQKVD